MTEYHWNNHVGCLLLVVRFARSGSPTRVCKCVSRSINVVLSLSTNILLFFPLELGGVVVDAMGNDGRLDPLDTSNGLI